MKKLCIPLIAAALLASCSHDNSKADAFGNFQAVETIISAESSGKLLTFSIKQGQTLAGGETVAIIDTTLYTLQKQELLAKKAAAVSQLSAANAQIAVVEQQLENVEINLNRIQKMTTENAATQKQLDDVSSQYKVVQNQLAAARAQKQGIAAELAAIDAKEAQLDEQLKRCFVVNPVPGTVLEKYAEAYELTAAGKPLYKIADLEKIELMTYVSGGELHNVKIDQNCTVRIDADDDFIDFPGTVTWISDKAEFTPKIIQTKNERVNLVYAVKILVENDGRIKIGMPGEVIFK